jgi:hypothetical protein
MNRRCIRSWRVGFLVWRVAPVARTREAGASRPPVTKLERGNQEADSPAPRWQQDVAGQQLPVVHDRQDGHPTIGDAVDDPVRTFQQLPDVATLILEDLATAERRDSLVSGKTWGNGSRETGTRSGSIAVMSSRNGAMCSAISLLFAVGRTECQWRTARMGGVRCHAHGNTPPR